MSICSSSATTSIPVIPKDTIIRFKNKTKQYTVLVRENNILKILRKNDETWSKTKEIEPLTIEQIISDMNGVFYIRFDFPYQSKEYASDFEDALKRYRDGESHESTIISVHQKQKDHYEQVISHFGNLKPYELTKKWNTVYTGVVRMD
jgi:hypothetical protein